MCVTLKKKHWMYLSHFLILTAIVFSYDYFPGAITLMSKHFSNPQPLNGFTSQFSMEGGSSRSFGSKGEPFYSFQFSMTRWHVLPFSLSPLYLVSHYFVMTDIWFVVSGMNNRSTPTLLSESLIWCYIVQLSSALRYIHSTGLAARTIEPSKILFYDKSR